MSQALPAHAWAGATVAILGAGPSLTDAQLALVREAGVRVIAINNTWRLAPWADVLYACDARWWEWEQGAPDFPGVKVSLEAKAGKWRGVLVYRNTGREGFDPDPTALRTGCNGGYQAIHLAAHLGVARMLLLGYDMRAVGGRTHYASYEERVDTKPPFALFLKCFPTLAPALAERRIEVLNCTPGSALSVWPHVALEEALLRVAA